MAERQLSILPEPDSTEWTNDDWATPWEVIRSLEAEFGPFELDPCATAESAKAPRFYTKAQDGLLQPWDATRIFCNPPYSDKAPWLQRAYEASLAGSLVVCLVPARTDAAWFHNWILNKAEIRFQRRRIVFRGIGGIDKTKRPVDGTIFAIYRPKEASRG